MHTLKGKISMVYLSLVLLIAVVGAVSVINLYKLSKSIDGLMTDNYKSIKAISNMIDSVEKQNNAILVYIYIDKQKGIDLFDNNNMAFTKWYNIEANNITEPGEKIFVKNINNYYVQYNKSFSTLIEIKNSQGTASAINYYNKTITPNFDKLINELKSVILLNEKAMFRGKDNTTNNSQQSMYIILILSIIAVIGGYLISRYFVNKFLKPIYSLTQSIKSVKAGDLNQQIINISQDEAGELAKEFNNMTKRLQQFEQSALGKLLAEKNKTLAIVKSITDPLIVLDTNYRIILINNACEEFFNLNEDNVYGKHFLEAIQNGALFEHISSILASDEDYKEKIIKIKADIDYYFNVVVTTFKDMDKNLIGLIVVFQDVTQLKKLEKVKTDFMATISHELKTPLTSIIMGTSLLSDESVGELNKDQRGLLSTIKEDETKLLNLINELLELTKIESDKALYKFEPCSIEDIVEFTVKQFYEQAKQKNVNLYYQIEEGLPKVNADKEKIIWAINNLITNSIKYTNAGDDICVSAYAKDNKMHVSVKDTGIGIPPEFQDKVFDKFFQVKGYDIDIRGTGLGLSIVKDIIEAHGGKIWCESQLDAGSNFIFTLPINNQEL